jgi:lipopolysaccharide biosynthesis protein
VNKLLIYAHFNVNESMAGYVFHTLRHFRALGYEVLVASTSVVKDDHALAKLTEMGCALMLVENIGYDFYAWRTAILAKRGTLESLQSLVLLNSSVHGPACSLRRFLECCEGMPADAVGATLSHEPKRHLQSYFYLFKPQLFRSAAFLQFWEKLVPYPDRQSTIDHHELGFTDYLVEAGFRVDAFHAAHDKLSPALKHPYLLMRKQVPFLKLRKLRKARHLLLQARLRLKMLTLRLGE